MFHVIHLLPLWRAQTIIAGTLSGSTAHEPDKIIQKYINIKNYHIPVLLFEIEIALKFAVVSRFGTDTLFLFPLHHLLLSST